MARRRSSNRRRRRGRFTFLYKLLSILAICAVIVVALTLFFKVNTIEVSGEKEYSEEQILEASGVSKGDNLFLLNKFDVANRLIKKLPYIENVRINRKLPDQLIISVTECSATFAATQDGTVWLVSPSGKIVGSCKPADAAALPVLDGCELLAPSVGSQIALSTDHKTQQTSLLSLLSALQSGEMLAQVNAIHLGSTTELTMDYAGRFSVVMPYGGDYPYLTAYLAKVVDTLETNETGTIDLTKDGEAHVLPS